MYSRFIIRKIKVCDLKADLGLISHIIIYRSFNFYQGIIISQFTHLNYAQHCCPTITRNFQYHEIWNLKCTLDGHWFAWNVHGIFQNHAIPLDNSSVTINLKLESSNEITGFWNLLCTFHANQCLSGVHTKCVCESMVIKAELIFSLKWTLLMRLIKRISANRIWNFFF